ncbi:hypothetical protein HELRODRAFT_169247 [Helobdella robusta]|uniref:HTH psq-type domain-containing protein n=1 Tax=Helobdella robusta TaxID=6412 RepID=T1F1M6_HELRO|nr:hypothetical protein HELRODRAFT_169247 [Helobdella robusta]ESO08409.1 hypothetical protein HELRODRAFT_169247 [Helobdella robusta]
MPRSCKRKSARGSYEEESLRQALAAIHDGTPVKTAARQYSIPQRTLRRHRDKKVLQPGKLKLGRFESDIPIQYEKELVSLIQNMEKALFGLSIMGVRKLAYDFAEKMGLKHRSSKKTKMAGVDWMHDFFASKLTDEPLPNTVTLVQQTPESVKPAQEVDHAKKNPKTTLLKIMGPIKIDNVRTRKRKSEKAALLTSSLYKNLLEKRENSKTMSKQQLINGSGKEKN